METAKDMVEASYGYGSTEVVLKELGESVADSVASLQRELSRYPSTLGAFVLDEMELNIPVSMRVDDIGQLMVTVIDGDTLPKSRVGRLRLRFKPVLGTHEPLPTIAEQSLETLNCLSPEEIQLLNSRRIFTVDDVLRVTNHASGRQGLYAMGLKTEIERLRNRAFLRSLSVLPADIVDALFLLDIDSLDRFLGLSAPTLTEQLRKVDRLSQSLTSDKVRSLQEEVRKYLYGDSAPA
ncbi:hypothetical protein V0288_08400 [Pannus brasiliensis CCIBt3594]|uniref:Uncharacterized protein n=1 Tax=Pannus brasiliensis CCIBt3594 TaxID=1427578 RepID=A0AAW9QUS7_9CHRO